MTDRATLIDGFIARAGWAGAGRAVLAGDASNRRYLRLRNDRTGESAVLMDAAPETGEDIRPFVCIARHLSGLGLSAPRILAKDENAGLLLLEDLGDALFARVLENDPAQEETLYATATDLLADLHRHPPPGDLAIYDPPLMTSLAALAFEWYLQGATGEAKPSARQAFCAELEPLLALHAAMADVLIQRDYHAENLLWLPGRAGVARVGLLDFQDAMAGHRAYDLVSLLQDARRDVPPEIEQAMLTRYIAATGQPAKAFRTAYHLLGAQRNLRIIGVFARLCLRDGKAHYVDLIPRVWNLLQRDLAQPALAPVCGLVADSLPPPSPEILTRLKEKCATLPALS